MTAIYIIIYLIGSVLAYGRQNAHFYEIEEKYSATIPRSKGNIFTNHTLLTILTMMESWVIFIVLILFQRQKYFIRFKNWK